MSEPVTIEMLSQLLDARLGGSAANIGQPNAGGAFAPPAGFATPGASIAAPTAVLIPIKVPLPDGSTLRSYLSFGGEYAAPAAFLGLVQQLVAAGYPVDAYMPRPQQGGGGWGGNSGGQPRQGGWNNGGGGGSWNGNRGGRF